MKLLDLSDIKAFDKLDEDWRERIKPINDPEADLEYEYTSSSGKRVYKIYLHHEGDSWYGSCNCPAGSRRHAEPIPICKHLAAALLLQPDFDLGVRDEGASFAHEAVKMEPGATGSDKSHGPVSQAAKEKILWPSAIPMMEACPASLEEAEIKIDRVGEPAKLGKAVHSICEEIVKTDRIPELRPFALENNVEDKMDDLEFLAHSACRLWEGTKEQPGLKRYFHNPSVEVTDDFTFQATNQFGEKVPVRIHGRADVQEIFDDHAIVLDWKTGRKHDEYNYVGQMKALAVLAAAKSKKIKKISTMLVWLREGAASPIVTFTREELKRWLVSFAKHDLFWDGKTYRPGPHCRFCPRYLECPARKKMLSQSIALFSNSDVTEKLGGWLKESEKLAIAIDQARLVAQAAKDFVEQAKELLDGHEPIPVPGKPGYGYAVVEGSGAVKILPRKAWPIISEELDEDDIEACISISATKLKKALMNKAEHGQKAAFMKEMMEKLEKAGALIQGAPRKSLKIIRIEEEQ